jgi:hypothetical protein
MKMKSNLSLVGKMAVCAASVACLAPISEAAITYSDDFSTNTLSNYSVVGSSGNTYSATAGVGGGGGIVINQDQNASTSFVPGSSAANTAYTVDPGESVTITMMMKLNASGFGGGVSKGFLGLTDSVNYGWGGNPAVGTSVVAGALQNAVEIGTRSGVNGGAASNGNMQPSVTLTGGNWYLYSTTLTKPTTGTTWTASGSLRDFGATGTTPGDVKTSFNNVNVTLAGDTTLSQAATPTFLNFGVRNQSFSAIDNFSVTTAAVPEPASLGLLAATGLLALRRRQA